MNVSPLLVFSRFLSSRSHIKSFSKCQTTSKQRTKSKSIWTWRMSRQVEIEPKCDWVDWSVTMLVSSSYSHFHCPHYSLIGTLHLLQGQEKDKDGQSFCQLSCPKRRKGWNLHLHLWWNQIEWRWLSLQPWRRRRRMQETQFFSIIFETRRKARSLEIFYRIVPAKVV